jgi:hypothetical protein
MIGELGGPASVITVTVNNCRMLSEFKGYLNVILHLFLCSPKAA